MYAKIKMFLFALFAFVLFMLVMPFMLIATWNDYEEGTQIETGVSDCHSRDENRNANSTDGHSGSSGAFVAQPGPTS